MPFDNKTGSTTIISLLTASFSPADTNAIYGGGVVGVGMSTTQGQYKYYPPVDLTIIGAKLTISVAGTSGTTETATVELGKNNTSFKTITSAALFDAFIQTYSATFSEPMLVKTTDYLQIKVTPPAWGTNPTNISLRMDLICAI